MKFMTIALLLHWSSTYNVKGCTHGDMRILGARSDTILAGRVSLCYESEWRTVCQRNWDKNDTMVVCKSFGFPPASARFCSDCLGSDSHPGINNFTCSGNEAGLIHCPQPLNTNDKCTHTIGVFCFSSNFTLIPQNAAAVAGPSTTSPPGSNPLVAAGAALGGIAAVFLLALVVVVMLWMWTCYKSSLNNKGNTAPPSSSSFPLHSAGYSSQGPRNMPQSTTSRSALLKNSEAAQGEGRIYDMPDGEYEVVKEKTSDSVYQLLEDTREGKRNEAACTMTVQNKGYTAYSMLNYH